MSYGLKLRIEYKDINDILTRINIYQDGYSGVADIRYAHAGIRVDWGDQGDELPLVYGSSCTIYFDAEFDFEFLYLFSADGRKHRVDIEKGGSIFWTGYVEPDSWSEPLSAAPYPVELTAYDGLGFLKDTDYIPNGRKTLSAILDEILLSTGLSIPSNISIEWTEAVSGNDILAKHTIDTVVFSGMSCYDVLEQLFIGCRIFQRSGQWWIVSNTILSTSAATDSPFWFEGNSTLNMLPAIKQIVIAQDFGYRDNLVENGSFEDFSDNTFPGWTNISVVPQQLELDNKGGKFVYIPGKQYPDSFADGGYGQMTHAIKHELKINQTTSILNVRLKYAEMGSAHSSLMFISVRLTGTTKNWYLRRKPYVEKEQEFEWSQYPVLSTGDDRITLGSTLKKTSESYVLINGVYEARNDRTFYYNSYENVTAYPADQISDHFATFEASAGIPEDGTLELYLYVPYSDRPEITGSCYSEIEFELLDENQEKYATGKQITVANSSRNNYCPDDVDLVVGDYPEIVNNRTIFAGGFRRLDDLPTTGWSVGDGSYYNYAEFIGRMIVAAQYKPRQMYEARLADLIPFTNLIFEDPNNPGHRFIENGISYDDRFQAVEGSFAELLNIDLTRASLKSVVGSNSSSGSGRSSGNNSNNTSQPFIEVTPEKVTIDRNLQVDGTITATLIKMTSGAGAGKLLVSDADGLMSYSSAIIVLDGKIVVNRSIEVSGTVAVENATSASHAVNKGQLENKTFSPNFLNATINDFQVYHAGIVNKAGVVWTVGNATQSGHAVNKGQLENQTFSPSFLDASMRDGYVRRNIGSESYFSGFAGSGWRCDSADNRLTVDYLTVRKEMSVYELVINQIRSTNGSLWVSDAAKVSSVVDGGSYFRCYVDTDGGNAVQPFLADDWIRCQKWTGRGIKYYSAKVTSVGADYFNITKTGIDGAGVPEAGDTIVRIGNTTNASRQGAIYLTSSDSNSPYLEVLDGVVSASLAGKTKVRLGKLDGITDAQFGALTGYGLYADNVFLKGKFEITGGNAETKDGAQAKIDAVQVGGRNLIKGTSPSTTLSVASWVQLPLSSNLVEGKTYILGGTFLIEANTLGGVWLNNGDTGLSTITIPVNTPFVATAAIATRTHLAFANQTGAGIVKVDDPKLELGNKATAWTPAPEDVYADATAKADAAKAVAIAASALDATSKADAAATSSQNYASGLVSALQNGLGAMAYENLVNLAKLDSTIIQGGYIKSSLLDVSAIRVIGSLATVTEVQGYASNAQSAAATDATNKVNAVQVGGRNLALFSNDMGIISLYGVNATYENIQNSTVPSKQVFKIYNIVREVGDYVFYIPSGNAPQRFSIPQGDGHVTISFYAKTNNTQVINGPGISSITIGPEWVKIIATTFWPGSGNLHYTLSGAGLTTLEIHSFKIEKGNKATDWTPAPEDVSEDATAKANAAATSAQNYSTGLYNSLNSAKQDAIVNGQTLIVGGYINTNFIEAGSIQANKIIFDGAVGNNVNLTGTITASSGAIGGFSISASGIVNDTGQAYVICRNLTEGRDARIGSSVFPLAGSGVSYFRNELYNPYAINYAVYAKARNSLTQYPGEKGYYAGFFDGHVKVVNGDLEVGGQISGVLNIPDSRIYHMGNNATVNYLSSAYTFFVGDQKTANRDYSLPDAAGYPAGTVIHIINWNDHDSYIRPYASQTINGYTKEQRYVTLYDAASCVALRSNGSNQWMIVQISGAGSAF